MVNPDVPLALNQKTSIKSMLVFLCAGRESNPHALRHVALNHACLPVPAPAQKQNNYNLVESYVKLNTKSKEGV